MKCFSLFSEADEEIGRLDREIVGYQRNLEDIGTVDTRTSPVLDVVGPDLDVDARPIKAPSKDALSIIQQCLPQPELPSAVLKKDQGPSVLSGEEGLRLQRERKARKEENEQKRMQRMRLKAEKLANTGGRVKKVAKKGRKLTGATAKHSSNSEPVEDGCLIIETDDSYIVCREIAEVGNQIRVSKMVRSGGIFFKWPEIEETEWHEISKIHPKIPTFKCMSRSRGLNRVPELDELEQNECLDCYLDN